MSTGGKAGVIVAGVAAVALVATAIIVPLTLMSRDEATPIADAPTASESIAPAEPSAEPSTAPAQPSASGTPSPTAASAPRDAVFEALMSAPVPAMCGQDAGELVDGVLPTPKQDGTSQGSVWLPWVGFTDGGSVPANDGSPIDEPLRDLSVALGDVDGDGVDEVAVVMQCYAGGVMWPANLVVYEATADAQLTPVGTFSFVDFEPAPARSSNELVTFRDDAFVVSWDGPADTCGGCEPDTSYLQTVTIEGGELVVSNDPGTPIVYGD